MCIFHRPFNTQDRPHATPHRPTQASFRETSSAIPPNRPTGLGRPREQWPTPANYWQKSWPSRINVPERRGLRGQAGETKKPKPHNPKKRKPYLSPRAGWYSSETNIRLYFHYYRYHWPSRIHLRQKVPRRLPSSPITSCYGL